eukprot:5751062-Pyramimonas_sp.AAC.1
MLFLIVEICARASSKLIPSGCVGITGKVLVDVLCQINSSAPGSSRVDVKRNIVDVKGSMVDIKDNVVDVKGNSVDAKG